MNHCYVHRFIHSNPQTVCEIIKAESKPSFCILECLSTTSCDYVPFSTINFHRLFICILFTVSSKDSKKRIVLCLPNVSLKCYVISAISLCNDFKFCIRVLLQNHTDDILDQKKISLRYTHMERLIPIVSAIFLILLLSTVLPHILHLVY